MVEIKRGNVAETLALNKDCLCHLAELTHKMVPSHCHDDKHTQTTWSRLLPPIMDFEKKNKLQGLCPVSLDLEGRVHNV